MRVIYTPQARDDLRTILATISVASPRGAARVAGKISSTVRLVSDFPGAGVVFRKRARVRRISIGRYPYSIFYRVDVDAIVIVHIRHDKRKSPKLAELR